MALLILLTLGSAVGWFASILLRHESMGKCLANIAIGAVGALASYGFAADGFALHTITPTTLLLGAFGAMIFLAFATIIRRQLVG